MQLSKKEVDPAIDQQMRDILFQVMADIAKPQDVKQLLSDLLTDAELVAIAKRLAIAYYLKQGKSYDAIRDTLKVSSATIASIQERLTKSQGFSVALEHIQADMWASKFTNRLVNLFKKETNGAGE